MTGGVIRNADQRLSPYIPFSLDSFSMNGDH